MLYVSSYAVSDVSRLGFVSCNAYTRTHARASYVFQYSQDGRLLDFKNLTRFSHNSWLICCANLTSLAL